MVVVGRVWAGSEIRALMLHAPLPVQASGPSRTTRLDRCGRSLMAAAAGAERLERAVAGRRAHGYNRSSRGGRGGG